MEWLFKKSQNVAFFVENTEFLLPIDIIERNDVSQSGLGSVYRREGFKEIPAKPPLTSNGAIRLDRPLKAFELLIRHLIEERPLDTIPIGSIAEAYIQLKQELVYWELPSDTVALPSWLWTRTAWTDEMCFYPIPRNERQQEPLLSKAEIPQSSRILALTKCTSLPSEMEPFIEDSTKCTSFRKEISATAKMTFTADATQLVCLLPKAAKPCVMYGSYPEDPNFTPLVYLHSYREFVLVWTKGTFFHFSINADDKIIAHVTVEEPSWLCVHPLSESLLSGIKGPVPCVHCLDMPNAGAIRFLPWGALVIAKSVSFKRDKQNQEFSGTQPDHHSGGIADALYGTLSSGKEPQVRPSNAECLLKAIKRTAAGPVSHTVWISEVGWDTATAATLELRKDYEAIETRVATGVYRIQLLVKGALAYYQLGDKAKPAGEGAHNIKLNKGNIVTSQPGISITSGAPSNDIVANSTLYGEYRVDEDAYYTFATGKKIFEYHKQSILAQDAEKLNESTCPMQ